MSCSGAAVVVRWRCSGLPAPCLVLQWLFSGAAVVCLRPARCCNHELFPVASRNVVISTFHFLTLWKSAEIWSFWAEIERNSYVLPGFYCYFHKLHFPIFWNPWYIRARNTCWIFFPFFRDFTQPDNEYSHTNSDCMQPDNEYSRQTATVHYSYLRGGWSNRCFQLLASTSPEFNPRNRCFSRVDLKHFKFQIICFNKIHKML